MSDSIKYLIERLKQAKIISSQKGYIDTLNSIDRFSDNDFHKAYLLGYFFKYKLDSDNLPANDKRFLIDTIKNQNLDTYFYLKTKPDRHVFGKLTYLFILIGFIVIIVGVIQLVRGEFWYGPGTKYLVPIMREGGYKIILGLIFLTGGLTRLKYEIKKRHFLKYFLTSNNDSN